VAGCLAPRHTVLEDHHNRLLAPVDVASRNDASFSHRHTQYCSNGYRKQSESQIAGSRGVPFVWAINRRWPARDRPRVHSSIGSGDSQALGASQEPAVTEEQAVAGLIRQPGCTRTSSDNRLPCVAHRVSREEFDQLHDRLEETRQRTAELQAPIDRLVMHVARPATFGKPHEYE
jgi:hypothetical protein